MIINRFQEIKEYIEQHILKKDEMLDCFIRFCIRENRRLLFIHFIQAFVSMAFRKRSFDCKRLVRTMISVLAVPRSLICTSMIF